MKVAILGFAGQGQSAYEYWNKPENKLTVCDHDENIQVPDGTQTQLGQDYLKDLGRFDLLIRTPALHPKDILQANPQTPDILDKVWSNTNEFFRVCPSKNIIGVTGTKGKGTTSTLIAKMLETAGKRVHLGGNIGTPPLELLKDDIQPNDYIVLELANFQLIDLKYSPHIAVCLMIAPEHLDWHKDIDEYVDAKSQLFIHQTDQDRAIYFAENELSEDIAASSEGKLIPYFAPPGAFVKDGWIIIDDKEICKTDELKLLGKHNWQNVCAAVTTVWQITQDIQVIRSVLTTFAGLEYRLEFIRELDGVSYYNDSFGTAPETAIVAIEAFEQPKVLILGGSSKNSDYSALAQTVLGNNVRSVIAIGDTGPQIAKILQSIGYKSVIIGCNTMKEIVDHAHGAAKPGDVVLLSTACASFGMFKNYKDRGEQFKAAVKELK